MAFPIEIDALQLTATQFDIPGVTPTPQPTRPDDPSKRIWPMEPGAYTIHLVGQVCNSTPTDQGVIRCDEKLDINSGCYLARLGSFRLESLDYPFGFGRPSKNISEAADARQKQTKKRSLWLENEHFESIFNATAATLIVSQRSVRVENSTRLS